MVAIIKITMYTFNQPTLPFLPEFGGSCRCILCLESHLASVMELTAEISCGLAPSAHR